MFARRMLALTALAAALLLVSCAPDSNGAPPTTTGSPSVSPSPSPSGSPLAEPSPTTDEEAAITIDAPTAGATVSVPFAVGGTANTFEAALTIDAIDESGLTACVRHLMATSGSGTRGTWEGVLAFPPEEDPLHITLRAYAYSAKDGSMIDLVEYPLTVSTDRPDIIVTSPRCGDVYPAGTPIQVLGTARLFEAALTVELRDSSGTPVLTLPVTAEECCVESNFSSTITVPAGLASGWYDFAAYSLSAKDGTVENEFTVQIQVTG